MTVNDGEVSDERQEQSSDTQRERELIAEQERAYWENVRRGMEAYETYIALPGRAPDSPASEPAFQAMMAPVFQLPDVEHEIFAGIVNGQNANAIRTFLRYRGFASDEAYLTRILQAREAEYLWYIEQLSLFLYSEAELLDHFDPQYAQILSLIGYDEAGGNKRPVDREMSDALNAFISNRMAASGEISRASTLLRIARQRQRLESQLDLIRRSIKLCEASFTGERKTGESEMRHTGSVSAIAHATPRLFLPEGQKAFPLLSMLVTDIDPGAILHDYSEDFGGDFTTVQRQDELGSTLDESTYMITDTASVRVSIQPEVGSEILAIIHPHHRVPANETVHSDVKLPIEKILDYLQHFSNTSASLFSVRYDASGTYLRQEAIQRLTSDQRQQLTNILWYGPPGLVERHQSQFTLKLKDDRYYIVAVKSVLPIPPFVAESIYTLTNDEQEIQRQLETVEHFLQILDLDEEVNRTLAKKLAQWQNIVRARWRYHAALEKNDQPAAPFDAWDRSSIHPSNADSSGMMGLAVLSDFFLAQSENGWIEVSWPSELNALAERWSDGHDNTLTIEGMIAKFAGLIQNSGIFRAITYDSKKAGRMQSTLQSTIGLAALLQREMGQIISELNQTARKQGGLAALNPGLAPDLGKLAWIVLLDQGYDTIMDSWQIPAGGGQREESMTSLLERLGPNIIDNLLERDILGRNEDPTLWFMINLGKTIEARWQEISAAVLNRINQLGIASPDPSED